MKTFLNEEGKIPKSPTNKFSHFEKIEELEEENFYSSNDPSKSFTDRQTPISAEKVGALLENSNLEIMKKNQMNKKTNSKSVLKKIKSLEKSFCFNRIGTPKKILEQTNSEFDFALIKNKNKQVEESESVLQRKITNEKSESSIVSNSEIRLSNQMVFKSFTFLNKKKPTPSARVFKKQIIKSIVPDTHRTMLSFQGEQTELLNSEHDNNKIDKNGELLLHEKKIFRKLKINDFSWNNIIFSSLKVNKKKDIPTVKTNDNKNFLKESHVRKNKHLWDKET